LLTLNKGVLYQNNPSPLVPAKPLSQIVLLNADSGANAHFITAADSTVLSNLRPAGSNYVEVQLPDGTTASSSHLGNLPIPRLPIEALQAHAMHTFTGSLLSISQICQADHGITATYDHSQVHIQRGEELILQGCFNPSTKVYEIALEVPLAETDAHRTATGTLPVSPLPLSAAPVITHQSQADLVRYWYTALGCPVWSTFIKALYSGILSIPGLTPEVARRNPQASIPSALGHLSLERKGVRSTKPVNLGRGRKPRQKGRKGAKGEQPCHTLKPSAAPALASETDTSPDALPDTVYFGMATCDDTFLDGTGLFPLQSRRGIRYVLVSTRRGYIHLEPLPNRTAHSQAKAHAASLEFWTAHGM
jgi:hypothetical protein